MSTADLPWTDEPPAPSAIEPQRVMILDEDEQRWLLNTTANWTDDALARRLIFGDAYADDLDEIVRRTMRKRRLLTEVKRETVAIERLTEPVVERLTEIGAKSLTHEATGTRIQRDDAVHLAYADPDWGSGEKADAKDAAGDVIAQIDELADFVQQTWAQRTVEAYFREQYKSALAEQHDKPEHERTPVDPDEILPEALRPYYRLSVKPRLKIVAT